MQLVSEEPTLALKLPKNRVIKLQAAVLLKGGRHEYPASQAECQRASVCGVLLLSKAVA
jgi:hypothetical protein